MNIEINQLSRCSDNTGVKEILCVTETGKWCRVSVGANGRVRSFGGSIWPGEMASVFVSGEVCAQEPVNLTLQKNVVEHFSRSVAPFLVQQ